MAKSKEELIKELIEKFNSLEAKQENIEGADEFLSNVTQDMTDCLKIEQIANLALSQFNKEDLQKYLDESNELLSSEDEE